ncbi:DNA-binding CsgD family transcriptional regulator [Kitasatospora sp. MAP12-15]|uniref:helix-turn-helix domain-containing protein n=1 Tax=unclassified Kitasatospora TaxID=2633591 RepID=UPI002474ADCD|nr:helix-turn-helix transcriptional regulator [Kitasatospora sp. MAP12-44]MDH6115558.1 ATP/maltotriose-dependent transcriptional regulator MalT [Kitasatospora sp. MAP12-44]
MCPPGNESAAAPCGGHAPGCTASGQSHWALDELAVAASAVHVADGDTGAALAALDVVSCEWPQHTVARARALLAAGRDGSALTALADLPSDGRSAPPSRVQACLLRVQAALRSGEFDEAHRLLAQALALGRPEQLRRLFVESGSAVHGLLRRDAQLAWAHRWLPAELLLTNGRTMGVGQPSGVVEPLSERERDVLNQAVRMLSTEEIAAELFVSVNTVKTHLKSVFRKLCVTRRSEAVHPAQELGPL